MLEDFCDSYIEMAKFSLNKKATLQVLREVLEDILKMLHPFMPFVTESIYKEIDSSYESIMISSYPIYEKSKCFNEAMYAIDNVRKFVSMVRTFKQENQVGKNYQIYLDVALERDLIIKLLKCEDNLVLENISGNVISYLDFKAVIYYEKERSLEDEKRVLKEIEALKSSILKRKALLSNDNFVKKAPESLVLSEKTKLEEEEKRLKNLEN